MLMGERRAVPVSDACLDMGPVAEDICWPEKGCDWSGGEAARVAARREAPVGPEGPVGLLGTPPRERDALMGLTSARAGPVSLAMGRSVNVMARWKALRA